MRPDPYSGSYNLGNPQSLNRYAYVGDDPINESDLDGLGCQWVLAPVWDNEGFIHGYHWVFACSSGVQNPRTVDRPDPAVKPKPKRDKLSHKRRKEFLDFLDSDKNKKCKEKLGRYSTSKGSYFDLIESAAGDVDFVDVNSIASEDSKKWFPNIAFNGSVGALFAKDALGAGLTLAVQTNSPRAQNNGPAGIYAIGGVDSSYFSGSKGLINLEHELAHYVTGLTDFGLVNLFRIPIPNDPATGQPISESEAVAVWFQAGCPGP